MSGFDNDTVYANNADFSRAGAGGGSALNGLQQNGQLWIGSTALNAGGTHVNVGLITSSGGTIAVSNNAGNINLEVAGGGAVTETLTGNTGGPVAPLAANINTIGSGSITIAGSAGTHTLTTKLTGLNNHAVLVGAGTDTITNVGPSATAGQILQSAGGAADPAFSTATYPSTTTINQILYSSSNNVVAGITAGNNGVLISSQTGIPSWLADGTTGQVLTATTNMPPTWQNPASSGTVTSVSVVTANGFAGSVANPTTTPAITISTTQTGVLTGNGTSITGTPITQYAVLTAGASNFPNSVNPPVTVGIPLISQGIVAQPAFGTAVVAGGGTGDTSFTPYTVICGGTTSTGNLQNVVSTGTSGQVLTSNGAGALPTFQDAAGGGGGWQFIQTITNTGGSSTNFTFNTGFGTFTELMVQYGALVLNASVILQVSFSADNGVTTIVGSNFFQSASTGGTETSTNLRLSSGPSPSYIGGYLNLQNMAGTVQRSFYSANMSGTTADAILTASPKINWIQFHGFGSVATIDGTMTLWGR